MSIERGPSPEEMGRKQEVAKSETESAVEEEKRKRKEELEKLYWELHRIPDNREFEARYIAAERAVRGVYNKIKEQLFASPDENVGFDGQGHVSVFEAMSEEEVATMRERGETVYGENYILKRELSPDQVGEETKELMKEHNRLGEEFETFVRASVRRRG